MSGFIKDEFLTTRAELDALLGSGNQEIRKSGNQEIRKSADRDTWKILLAGDISKAFSDAELVRELPCEVHTNMPDAIDAAAKNNFAAIGVVMSGSGGKLKSALKALRDANCDAKIILLARMYEEPAAMQMVSSSSNGSALADDYLICPTHFPYLVSRISYLVKGETQYDIRNTQYEKIKELEKLATEDELTGLKNRRYIWEFFRQIVEHAKKKNGRVTLLVFDIDNFKHYNDVYGHSAGDEILRQAAVLMQRCCRQHDVVGRIGGDEFAVVFWDDLQVKSVGSEDERRSTQAEHPKEAMFVIERFRNELNATKLPSLGPEGKGVLTISGGLASFASDGSTIEELFTQADAALLEAKRSGKNRIYLVGKPQNDIADIE
jgi:diguanylate cyclase (GGDEF)-like protein